MAFKMSDKVRMMNPSSRRYMQCGYVKGFMYTGKEILVMFDDGYSMWISESNLEHLDVSNDDLFPAIVVVAEEHDALEEIVMDHCYDQMHLVNSRDELYTVLNDTCDIEIHSVRVFPVSTSREFNAEKVYKVVDL